MKTNLTILSVAMTGLLVAGVARGAAEDEPVRLGPRYTDLRAGFSLCPPAGADRSHQASATKLVTWQGHDEATGAVAWTLTVIQAPQPAGEDDPAVLAARLVKQLTEREGLQVTSSLVEVGGAQAVDVRGMTQPPRQIWQRQLWVPAPDRKYLVLHMTGPAQQADRLDATWRKVVETFEQIDPETALKRRDENLARGRKLLEGLTEAKLAAVLQAQPQWLLLRQEGKTAGFMKVIEGFVDRDGAGGVEVSTWVWVDLQAKAGPAAFHTVMFATTDRAKETWTVSTRADRQGAREETYAEQGLRDGDRIVCTTTAAGGRPDARTVEIPEVNRPVYLPRAIGAILPRFVDLDEKATYAFAVYSSRAGAFDMRTLTVGEKRKIELDGRKVQAVRVTEQVAEDEPAYDNWVDEKGVVLRGDAALQVVTSTRAAVLKHFPKAEAIIAGMNP